MGKQLLNLGTPFFSGQCPSTPSIVVRSGTEHLLFDAHDIVFTTHDGAGCDGPQSGMQVVAIIDFLHECAGSRLSPPENLVTTGPIP